MDSGARWVGYGLFAVALVAALVFFGLRGSGGSSSSSSSTRPPESDANQQTDTGQGLGWGTVFSFVQSGLSTIAGALAGLGSSSSNQANANR